MKIDEAVAAIAERQYGAFARRQLRAVGGDRGFVRRRTQSGLWIPATGQVLRIRGAPRSPEQDLMIAVLDVGPDGRATHRSAAWLWGLPGFAETTEVGTGRSNGGPVPRAGHRSRLVLPHHLTEVRGIPCTSLPRTFFDLAAVLPLGRMARLVDTVVTRSPAMLNALHRTLGELAAPGRDGITVMRTLLSERPVGTKVAASGNEARFEQICRNAGLRGFERQVDVGGHSWLGRCDYRRLDVRLIVEIDSRLHHSSVTDKANDAARDAARLAAGWRKVLRIWEEDLWQHPFEVVETVRNTLLDLGAPELQRFGAENGRIRTG